MVKTYSKMLELGTVAADFRLKDTVSSEMIRLSSYVKDSKGTVVMFICNHCPFVKHINKGLVKLAKDYQSKGISFIAISSNDALNYPDDAPELMRETAIKEDYTFPYLYDETQEVAILFQAACTPDFYLFDSQLKLVYRGQMDDSRPGNQLPVTGSDLRHALDCLLAHQINQQPQKPSMGCNIKWKSNSI
jgi:thiol-disulfide isomerase/thioredoxin